MTTFVWVDRNGVHLHVQSPDALNKEVDGIEDEIMAEFELMEQASADNKYLHRLKVTRLSARLTQLSADLTNFDTWNMNHIIAEANKLADSIENISEPMKELILCALLHNEHMELLNNPEARDERLAGGMTDNQKFAIYLSRSSERPPLSASRGEVYDWLQQVLGFIRPVSDEGGWFKWIDNEGASRRLLSQLAIELELAALWDEALGLVPRLRSAQNENDPVAALIEYDEIEGRISQLQTDLDLFKADSASRTDKEWEACAREYKQAYEKKLFDKVNRRII